MSNATEETIVVRRVVVAPTTIIEWNSRDGTGSVRFDTKVEVSHNGEFNRYEDGQQLSFPLSAILHRTFKVGGVELPAMLLMGAIKAAFDELYAESAGL